MLVLIAFQPKQKSFEVLSIRHNEGDLNYTDEANGSFGWKVFDDFNVLKCNFTDCQQKGAHIFKITRLT